MTELERIHRILEALPDLPRWIEARAILLSGRCTVFESESGAAIRNDAQGGRLVALFGRPDRTSIDAALADRSDHELLCAPEDESHVARLFPHWERERGVLHELTNRDALAAADARVRLLDDSDSLEHLPDDLRAEIESALVEHEVWAAFELGRPVCFAHAFWRTARWFDISIDTLIDNRRRGLARSTVSQLIRCECALERMPVWGAMTGNRASLQLAAKLGFTATDSVVVATPG